jgi:PAS domain S-box-containing protein
MGKTITPRLEIQEEDMTYLSAIVESSNDAIIGQDFNGLITFWNAAAERFLGYASHEVLGEHINLIILPENHQHEDSLLEAIKSDKHIDRYDASHRTKEGRMIGVSVTVSPIRDRSGNIIGASKIIRPMSQDLDNFLSKIGHELRTPMNVVIGIGTLFSKAGSLTEKQKQYVDMLNTSSNELLILINNLFDLKRDLPKNAPGAANKLPINQNRENI